MKVDRDRLSAATRSVIEYLLSQRTPKGHWEGELSTSALSTATAVMAFHQVAVYALPDQTPGTRISADDLRRWNQLIDAGVKWLISHQNSDGGWGDTDKSVSNISTTMLCHATLVATRPSSDASLATLTQGQLITREEVIHRAATYIEQAGGVPAMIARYGKDKTFSVPILTHCALAGVVSWKTIPRLPFELSCIPATWYSAVKLPVVSYALPALIAIGQVRHFHGRPWNPLTRGLRWLARDRSLRVLEAIQPPHGGFLEAAPLTSFVCMSLANMGLVDHPVVRRAIQFLETSVRPDGSWPIDTNLSTWVTTLAVNALADDLPEKDRPIIREWLIAQQFQQTHPFTNAAPGGWAWTNLSGGVPDADDTPGAVLALRQLDTGRTQHAALRAMIADYHSNSHGEEPASSDPPAVQLAIDNGLHWLLGLQNRDGGFPTFCRGWGTLPFDRSSPDLTAHCLRALQVWIDQHPLPRPDAENFDPDADLELGDVEINVWGKIDESIDQGFRFLKRVQRADGSWLPLWFGNQNVHDDENPAYGTSRVLKAFQACRRWDQDASRAAQWLFTIQNSDGGWGGAAGAPSTTEETALVLDALLASPERTTGTEAALDRGVMWLVERVMDGSWRVPSPIGFYFAKLWYYEQLYPVIWTVAALRQALIRLEQPAEAS